MGPEIPIETRQYCVVREEDEEERVCVCGAQPKYKYERMATQTKQITINRQWRRTD